MSSFILGTYEEISGSNKLSNFSGFPPVLKNASFENPKSNPFSFLIKIKSEVSFTNFESSGIILFTFEVNSESYSLINLEMRSMRLALINLLSIINPLSFFIKIIIIFLE